MGIDSESAEKETVTGKPETLRQSIKRLLDMKATMALKKDGSSRNRKDFQTPMKHTLEAMKRLGLIRYEFSLTAPESSD